MFHTVCEWHLYRKDMWKIFGEASDIQSHRNLGNKRSKGTLLKRLLKWDKRWMLRIFECSSCFQRWYSSVEDFSEKKDERSVWSTGKIYIFSPLVRNQEKICLATPLLFSYSINYLLLKEISFIYIFQVIWKPPSNPSPYFN